MLRMDELIELHTQERDIEEHESLDPAQSKDRVTLIKGAFQTATLFVLTDVLQSGSSPCGHGSTFNLIIQIPVASSCSMAIVVKPFSRSSVLVERKNFLVNFNLEKLLSPLASLIGRCEVSSATGNRSVAANISKGLKLFDNKFVSKVSFTEPDFLMNDDFFIQGFVKAEMKKKVTYKPSVQIRTTCQVISATCTCPAGGIPAFCQHVFALLHAINENCTKL
ncbi:SWIM-type domain-containing protein [Trichonephila clavipes]|nr:SWIM-type domain-containing protein [Trichonephila clavipes]